MYNLTEFKWKKIKGMLWEKWTFLKLVPKEKKHNPNSSYTICLARSTELLLKGKNLQFHLSHGDHCPGWCTACTFLPQCLPKVSLFQNWDLGWTLWQLSLGSGRECNNLSPDWECLGLSLQHSSVSAAWWRENALTMILVRFLTMHDTANVVFLIWYETWCDFSSRQKC